jgi:hypothetical protein
MAKLEAWFKGNIVTDIRKAGGYARRVEDQYGVGILDLILSLPETGLILAEAKRFTGRFFEPSPRQYIEMLAVDAGGGKALLIGVKDDVFYLSGTVRDDGVRGRAFIERCAVQQEGETFPQLLQRWYKGKY